MPTLTVDLAKTYSLSLRESTARRVDWEGMAGQNKLRRFFAHPDWQSYIAQVSVSSAGAKGGVFFLEAYEITPAAFQAALVQSNSNVDAPAAWRRLHKDNHLAGGIIGPQPASALDTTAWRRPERRVPAVVKPQVINQADFSLTDPVYGNTPAARSRFLTTLRNAARLQKRYVVKGTTEPGRVLFAEYVLNTIGKAKIPKSLVLEIDPSRPHTDANPSEGMIMLNLIDTRRNPEADATRYDAGYANLHDPAQSVVDYLVVQKLMAGDTFTDERPLTGRVVKFLCDQKIIVDTYSFSALADFAGESEATLDTLVRELASKGVLQNHLVAPSYQPPLPKLSTLDNKRKRIEAVLAAALPTLTDNGLTPANYYKGAADQLDQLVNDLQGQTTPLAQALTRFLDELRPIIATNERILSDPTMMSNTGRVHFADALLGNGDRFEAFNTGNMFYVTRQAAPGSDKASNPVGCIDNDSFLPTYLPSHVEGGFASAEDYVLGVLKPEKELWGWTSANPPGMLMAPNMELSSALNYDTMFTYFFKNFIRYDLPRAVLELYSTNFFARGDTDPFTTTQALPAWVLVRRSLREGVVDALSNYLSTDKRDRPMVYAALTERYFAGPNFEYTALEIRDRYLAECRVDQTSLTITRPTTALLKTLRTDIENWLITSGRVNPECDAPQVSPIADDALTAGAQPGNLLTADQEANIRQLLSTIAVSDQERILPNPFGSKPIPGLTSKTKRRAFDTKWGNMDLKYRNRMTAVICALLRKFWDEYDAEVGYLTHDRNRVLGSAAFDAATSLRLQVSHLRLATDERKMQNDRTKVLHGLDLVNHVFAS